MDPTLFQHPSHMATFVQPVGNFQVNYCAGLGTIRGDLASSLKWVKRGCHKYKASRSAPDIFCEVELELDVVKLRPLKSSNISGDLSGHIYIGDKIMSPI